MARRTAEERLRSFFVIGSPDECWPWLGYVAGNGYGRFALTPNGHPYAHRAVYELLLGPIPDGLDIDHECHNRDQSCVGGPTCPHRSCVNPAHLRPATRGTNLRAGRGPSSRTHCPKGHPYDEANTILDGGARKCRACRRERDRARRPPGSRAKK